MPFPLSRNRYVDGARKHGQSSAQKDNTSMPGSWPMGSPSSLTNAAATGQALTELKADFCPLLLRRIMQLGLIKGKGKAISSTNTILRKCPSFNDHTADSFELSDSPCCIQIIPIYSSSSGLFLRLSLHTRCYACQLSIHTKPL